MRVGLCYTCEKCEYVDIFFEIKCERFGKTTPKAFCRYYIPVVFKDISKQSDEDLVKKFREEIEKRLQQLKGESQQ